jgi:5'-nucleotidase
VNSRPIRILVTNDDGVMAPGIQALARALAPLGEVYVVAPDREQSASSHALTLQQPLRLNQLEERVWSVTGTPTDSVLVAVHGVMRAELPDLVVSGINAGPNMGDDVTYSGTVSAAFEGTLLSIPSIAISLASLEEPFHYETAALWAARLARQVLSRRLPPKTLLNVNVPSLPAEGIQGVRLTRLGHRVYRETISEKTDPRGRPYYWVGGYAEWAPEETTDIQAIRAGYVSITPLNLDMTDYKLLIEMETWKLGEAPPAGGGERSAPDSSAG